MARSVLWPIEACEINVLQYLYELNIYWKANKNCRVWEPTTWKLSSKLFSVSEHHPRR